MDHIKMDVHMYKWWKKRKRNNDVSLCPKPIYHGDKKLRTLNMYWSASA